MKLLKLLSGRLLFVLAAMAVQIGILSIVFLYFYRYFVAFQIVSIVLGLLLFLHMLNKNQCPEFKLAWMLILLTLPYFGAMFYIFFGLPRINRRQMQAFQDFKERKKRILPPKRYEKSLKAALGTYEGAANYLSDLSHADPHTGNRVSYFATGEDFHRDLLCELKKAERFIFMEYFIIEPGEMWDSIHAILLEKLKAGVEVRILYDDIGNFGKTPFYFYKKLQKEGINCHKFNPIRPVLSSIHNNRDHRKITVIDGTVAYTGGINIGDAYINVQCPLGHWKDTAIKLEGSSVCELTYLFLQTFDAAARSMTNLRDYIPSEIPSFEDAGCVQPFGDGPRPLYSEQIGENNFLNLIGAARESIRITTPYLVLDHNLTTALCNAAKRGVQVQIITPHIPDKKLIFQVTRSHYKPLLEAGVQIYEYTPGFIHAKAMVCDDCVAFVGTINMDYRSLVHHFECGAVLYHTPCIADITSDFEETRNRSGEITLQNFRMNGLATLFCSLLKVFFPLL